MQDVAHFRSQVSTWVATRSVLFFDNVTVFITETLCKTPFTRYNRLSNWLNNRLNLCLHDTIQPVVQQLFNRFNNRLYRVDGVLRDATTSQQLFRTAVLMSSTLGRQLLKAKFHYASWFEAGRRQVRSLSATNFEPVCDQLRTSFELDSVMEFGREPASSCCSLLASYMI